MRRQPVLAAMLADPVRVAARAAGAAAIREGWAADPAVVHLRNLLAGLDPDDADAAVDALRPVLTARAWLDGMLGTMVQALARDSLAELPVHAGDDGRTRTLVLVEAPAATLALVAFDAGALPADPPLIGVGGHRLILVPLAVEDLRAELWHGTPVDDRFTAAEAPRLRRGATIGAREGEPILVDGRRDGIVWSGGRGPVLLLRATVRAGRSAFARTHRRSDGRLVATCATDEAGSRMAMLASLVAAGGDPAHAPALTALLGERDFSLRWLGARLVCGLDPALGARTLRQLAERDPHPEVRAAAAAALQPAPRKAA